MDNICIRKNYTDDLCTCVYVRLNGYSRCSFEFIALLNNEIKQPYYHIILLFRFVDAATVV